MMRLVVIVLLAMMGSTQVWAGPATTWSVPGHTADNVLAISPLSGAGAGAVLHSAITDNNTATMASECCSAPFLAVSPGFSPCSLDKLMVHTPTDPFFPGRARLKVTLTAMFAGSENAGFIFRPPIV